MEVVGEAVTPVATELDKLAKEVRGQEAAEEALDQTTKKGPDYENEVLEDLQQWAGFAGAEVHYVGTDNRPGDILIKLPAVGVMGTPLVIVIETRDRQSPVGRKVARGLDARLNSRRSQIAKMCISQVPLCFRHVVLRIRIQRQGHAEKEIPMGLQRSVGRAAIEAPGF